MKQKKNYTKKSHSEKVEVVGFFMGYDIVKVTQTWYSYSSIVRMYNKHFVISVNTFYEFCHCGKSNCPSLRYMCNCSSPESVFDLIRLHVNGKRIILNRGEYNKWVIKPNAKNDWGFNDKMLYGILSAFKMANARRQMGFIERLDDANFHNYAYMLENHDYEGFVRQIKNDWGK